VPPTDDEIEALARRMLDDGAGMLICAAGPFGSLACEVIVDTCGAGDAFTSRLVLECLNGSSLQAATVASTAACAYVGLFPQPLIGSVLA
jgi:sugar/nucleoside kinase (ribokinase family)